MFTRTRYQYGSLRLKKRRSGPEAWEFRYYFDDSDGKFGALLSKFEAEEMPTRYSTRKSYQSIIKTHIRPKWADYPLDRIKPMPVEQWLKQVTLAPKSKAHVRSLMHLVFTCAERWCLIEMGKNPIALVRVKDCTKRLKRPQVLTVEQFSSILPRLKEPYRTMVIVAQCLGLRVSEIVALKVERLRF